MSSDTRQVLNLSIGFIFTLAIAGNAYFVKRLVDQVDQTRQIALDVQKEVAILKAELGVESHDEPFDSWANRVRSRKQNMGRGSNGKQSD